MPNSTFYEHPAGLRKGGYTHRAPSNPNAAVDMPEEYFAYRVFDVKSSTALSDEHLIARAKGTESEIQKLRLVTNNNGDQRMEVDTNEQNEPVTYENMSDCFRRSNIGNSPGKVKSKFIDFVSVVVLLCYCL